MTQASPRRYAGLDRAAVGQVDLTVHSIAAMCPSVSALGTAFALPVLVGPGAWLSVLLGFTVALGLASTFGEFSSRMVAPGSLVTWTAKGLGAGGALVALAGLTVGYVALSGFGMVAAVRRLDSAILPDTAVPSSTLVLLVTALAVLLWGVLRRGIRWSTRFASCIEVLALAGLVLALSTLAVQHGLPGPGDLDPRGSSPGQILLGAALILTLTCGFDSAATLGVESHRPHASVPRAMRRALLLNGALVLGSVVLNSGPGQGRSPGYTAWFGSPVADGALLLVLATSLAVVALVGLTTLGRLLFAVSRAGAGLVGWGRTDPVTGVPVPTTLLAVALVLGPALAVAASGRAAVLLLDVATTALALTGALTAAAAIPFLARLGELTPRVCLVAAGAAVSTLALWAALVLDGDTQRTVCGLCTVGGVLVLAGAARLALGPGGGSALAGLGAHDTPVPADLAPAHAAALEGRGV